jgi:double-stranded uracil-DNA glycosylase
MRKIRQSGHIDHKRGAQRFPRIFAKYPNITHVFFNGGKSEEVFRRRVLPALPKARHVFARLPSTSPANASVTLADKVKKWSALRKILS